ncbi:MAG: 50S ribosomal protein L31 [Chloroflexi bacterium]|jgi:large subunit ribosomal protein L31|nr:50S ribosomal protein L31 [Anaerolineae bacterium]MCC6564164.1 50S ribosomal protein L31 [Chloroflexota bacterium]OQY78292.1 MAG: 50S ribosomal protein L31 [Anaerolineae bacterium UTCFX5]MCO6443473.1 50S ribosomal protein L31 [Anaerolineae bacterium]MEB2365395.1 50S ribosomal protein L31 [Chloroflexota bacterium]
MKAKIHPKWYPAATVVCACGNTWTTGATIPEIRTDICSACHPFYTGEQRIVDTEGQIDRFLKKLQVRTNMAAEAEARAAIKAAPANPTLQDLGLDKRTINSLKEAGVEFANELLHKLVDEGEDAILAIGGIGRQSLISIKKALRSHGYEVPGAEAE